MNPMEKQFCFIRRSSLTAKHNSTAMKTSSPCLLFSIHFSFCFVCFTTAANADFLPGAKRFVEKQLKQAETTFGDAAKFTAKSATASTEFLIGAAKAPIVKDKEDVLKPLKDLAK